MTISLAGLSASPSPSAEWTVQAPMRSAAAPVEAVTNGSRMRSFRTVSRNDLPDPGVPMRSTFSLLCTTALKAAHCELLRPRHVCVAA